MGSCQELGYGTLKVSSIQKLRWLLRRGRGKDVRARRQRRISLWAWPKHGHQELSCYGRLPCVCIRIFISTVRHGWKNSEILACTPELFIFSCTPTNDPTVSTGKIQSNAQQIATAKLNGTQSQNSYQDSEKDSG